MKKYILFLVLFFIGCAYNSGVIQRAEKSYFQFSGDSEDISIVIDESSPFLLKEKGLVIDKRHIIYEVSNGKHRLKIYRNNQIILDRVVFLEDQATMEILIP